MTKNLELVKEINLELNNQINPKDILFFSGAGISIPPPTNLPCGVDLHRMLLEYAELFSKEDARQLSLGLCFEETVSRLSKLHNKEDNFNQFLNILTEVFICREQDGLLNLVPNDYHKYFDWHLNNFGVHFTVNLDQLIETNRKSKSYIISTKEKAIEYNYPIPTLILEGFLLKVHGDATLDEWKTQGCLIENIQQFNTDFKNYLDYFVNNANFVIFVGYGGVDKFDITPYFTEKNNGHFSNTNALWIEFGGGNDLRKPKKISNDCASIISKFNKSMVIETLHPEIILNGLFKNSPIIINAQRCDYEYNKEIDRFLKDRFDGLNSKKL